MSRSYDLYLFEHRHNVKRAFEWIKENLPEILDLYYGDWKDLAIQICEKHDESKDMQDEYDAYDRYFYGNNRSFAVVQEFNQAWLKHIHRNPHHWQHYVLVNDDPEEGMVALDMPFNYILEMICDWFAFSFKSDNLHEIFNWYDKHKDYIILSDKTRHDVEYILGKIKEKLSACEDNASVEKLESEKGA